MPKWIDKSGTFGIGKNAIKYGEDMPAGMDKAQLKELRASGQVGEILAAVTADTDTVPADDHVKLMGAFERVQADNVFLRGIVDACTNAIDAIVKSGPNREVKKILDTLKGEGSGNG